MERDGAARHDAAGRAVAGVAGLSAATAYAALRRLGAPLLTTGEAAAALRTSPSSASRALRTLAERGLVRRIRYGLWAITPEPLDPRRIIAELTRPFPAYVSFQSALAAHGAIDQIPREIAAASLAKPRRVRTELGTYAIHRLPPEFFGGYEGRDGIALATVEKALFDYFYVACATGDPNRRLPELDLPADFSRKEVDGWIVRIRSPRLRTLVAKAVARALEHAEYEDARRERRLRRVVAGARVSAPATRAPGAGSGQHVP